MVGLITCFSPGAVVDLFGLGPLALGLLPPWLQPVRTSAASTTAPRPHLADLPPSICPDLRPRRACTVTLLARKVSSRNPGNPAGETEVTWGGAQLPATLFEPDAAAPDVPRELQPERRFEPLTCASRMRQGNPSRSQGARPFRG